MVNITSVMEPLLRHAIPADPADPGDPNQAVGRFAIAATAVAAVAAVGMFYHRKTIWSSLKNMPARWSSIVAQTNKVSPEEEAFDALAMQYTNLVEEQNQYLEYVKQEMQKIEDDMTKVLLKKSQYVKQTQLPQIPMMMKNHSVISKSCKTPEELRIETIDFRFTLLDEAIKAYPKFQKGGSPDSLKETIEARKEHHQKVEGLARSYLGERLKSLAQIQLDQTLQEIDANHVFASQEQRSFITRV